MPRANFECKPCGVVHEDLPVESKCCPVTGRRRGFKRLFDTVQVSTRGHRAARFIDPRMTRLFDEQGAQRDRARQYERESGAAVDRSFEEASPTEREAAARGGMTRMPGLAMGGSVAGAALGMLEPAARQASGAALDVIAGRPLGAAPIVPGQPVAPVPARGVWRVRPQWVGR